MNTTVPIRIGLAASTILALAYLYLDSGERAKNAKNARNDGSHVEPPERRIGAGQGRGGVEARRGSGAMAEPKASTADPRRATAAAWLRSLAERARPGSELEHEGARDRAAETEGAEMALRRGLLQSKSAGRWSRISRELEGRRPEWAQRAKQLALDLRLAWAGRLDGEVEDVFVRQLDLLDELNDEDDRTASVLELREELDAMARQGLAGDLPDLARKRAADIGEDEQVRNHQRREEN